MMKLKKKEFLFGGSFDPPTLAHKKIMEIICNDYNGCLKILPNSDNYHKQNKKLTMFNHRVKMLEILTKDLNVEIITSEKDAPFTGIVDSLERLHHPTYVIGADLLIHMHSWLQSKKLIEENTFLIIPRKDVNVQELFNQIEIYQKNIDHFEIAKVKIEDFSSSTFRNEIVEEIISEDVLDYIKTNHLYDY